MFVDDYPGLAFSKYFCKYVGHDVLELVEAVAVLDHDVLELENPIGKAVDHGVVEFHEWVKL